MTKKIIQTGKPKCPNHEVELTDIDWSHGKGICPVSGWEFDFTADTEQNKKDKNGNPIKSITIQCDENCKG